MSTLIDGKPVKEYVSLPYGHFERLVREKVDPLYRLPAQMKRKSDAGPFKKWRVVIEYRFSGTGTEVLEVEASNIEEAQILADAKFQTVEPDFFDGEVDRYKITSTKRIP